MKPFALRNGSFQLPHLPEYVRQGWGLADHQLRVFEANVEPELSDVAYARPPAPSNASTPLKHSIPRQERTNSQSILERMAIDNAELTQRIPESELAIEARVLTQSIQQLEQGTQKRGTNEGPMLDMLEQRVHRLELKVLSQTKNARLGVQMGEKRRAGRLTRRSVSRERNFTNHGPGILPNAHVSEESHSAEDAQS